MRKFFLAVMLVFAAVTVSFAQQLGIKGGMTANKVDMSWRISDMVRTTGANRTGLNIGLVCKLPVTSVFTLQPELLYVKKHQSIRYETSGDEYVVGNSMSYLQLPVNCQFGLNLVVCRPFIFASPFLAYALNRSGDVNNEIPWSDFNRFSYGIGAGAGIDIWKIQFAFKYSWDLNKLGSHSTRAGESYEIEEYLSSRNRGFELSLAFFF